MTPEQGDIPSDTPGPLPCPVALRGLPAATRLCERAAIVHETAGLHRILRAARDVIDQGFDDARLSRALIADRLGTSPRTLDRHARAVLDLTSTQWLQLRRVHHALHRLCTLDESLEAAALASGYRSAETFARNFRKLVGVTPRRFQEILLRERRKPSCSTPPQREI